MPLFPYIGQQLIKLGRSFLGQPLSSGGRVFSVSTPEVYAKIGVQTAIDKGFEDNTAVYSIVMKDAKKFASIPRYLYDAGRKEEKGFVKVLRKLSKLMGFVSEVKAFNKFSDKTALIELLKRPNKNQSQDAFMTLVRAYYKICGESFIWLNRGDIEDYRNADGSFDDEAINKLPILEMQVLPANYITIIPDPTDLWGCLGYIMEIGERVAIRKDDVIHWKMPSLEFDAAARNHMRGMPPLQPGSKTLEENNSMAKASMRQAQNDGAKAVIYEKSMAAMTPGQQSQLKSVIDRKINNNDVAGAVATLQGDWGMLDLSMSAKDMELLAAKAFTWQELCFLFGVPYEFFDGKTNYANKEMAQVGWITNDVGPDCKQFDEELNRMLLPAFGLQKKAFIGSDISELPEVRKAMVEAAKVLLDIWCISPDEVREFLDMEALGGDFAEPWVPRGRTPLSKSNIDDGGDALLNDIQNGRGAASED